MFVRSYDWLVEGWDKTLGALPLPFARWIFSSDSYSYPSGSCQNNMINAIRWKRN